MIRCFIEELRKIDSENSYYLYSDRDFDLPWEDERWRKRVSSPIPFLPGTLWLQIMGRRMILRDQLDVFWGTNNMLPLGLPSGIAKILTIHDLLWPLYAEIAGPFHRCMHWLFVERSVRQADRIIAISQSTARDLQHTWKLPESKIEVIPHGVASAYRPQDSRAAAEYVAKKYGVLKEYVLTVGTLGPHKNLITVIKAMKILRGLGELPFQLVAVGAQGGKNSRMLEAVRSSGLTREDIRFLGFVPEEDLPMLYSASSALVFPSLYEGFGLPLVEAMACGVPVVASNTSSIPEVVGDAALLAPPTQPEAFAEAIMRVRSDTDLRKAMVQKGLNRAACFRWDKAASRLLECMRNVFGEKRSICCARGAQ